jgi:hypothetical protein
MVLQPFVLPLPLQFRNLFTQTVGLIGRVISPSQGRYPHTGRHKHRTDAYRHLCLERNSNPRSQVHALDRVAIVIGRKRYTRVKFVHTLYNLPVNVNSSCRVYQCYAFRNTMHVHDRTI